ncbi:CHASE2 domain-containing protein [Phormidesmis sp. 146-35]
MSQLIVLNLGKGDWQQGWMTVTAQFWEPENSTPMQFTASLPPAPELENLYVRWQRFYENLSACKNWRRYRNDDPIVNIEIDEADITHISDSEFNELCQELRDRINTWLYADQFRHIDRQLRTRLTLSDEIRFVITAENESVLQIPWCLWHFFEDYPKAELALSLANYARSLKVAPPATGRVKILAVMGSQQGIDITTDRELLEQLPNVELTLLIEPNCQVLNQQLWEPGIDVLFFAGHSSSRGQGRIQINQTESLTLDQLRHGLRHAIAQGLKLAIFNSCDGLGLAWDLADLQIPQVIVMREPVPDQVAQAFLKQFLIAFSGGQSLYRSVREARERLQAIESDFPCASWLPVVCQNPAEVPPTWQDWINQNSKTLKISQPAIQTLKSKISRVLLSSFAVTALVLGVRSLGALQSLELWTFDRLLSLRPTEQPDSRFLIVTINEADIQAQTTKYRQGTLSDQTLLQLLNVLEQHQPRAIGLDIYRDFPTAPKFSELAARLRKSDRIIALCKGRDAKYDPTGIAPPPEVPETRLGFSDFLEDRDGILRRQILFMDHDPISPCKAPYAFGTQLALRYLITQNITPQFTSEGNLQLGSTVFHRLKRRTGGYQGIDAQGNQILLNYRAASTPGEVAPQIMLTDILTKQIDPNAIRDRIILIGVTASSTADTWATPYGSDALKRVPGVFIQAQMASQILSAVLDQRPLVWVWSGWIEGVWILGWAIAGGAIFWMQRSQIQQALITVAILGMLPGISFVVFIQGGWIPLIPAAIAVLATGTIVIYWNRA